jgi:peptide/nickel transport system permease protein
VTDGDPAATAGRADRVRTRYRSVLDSPRFREFTRNRLNVFALVVIALLSFAAVFAEPIRLTVPTLVRAATQGLLPEHLTVQPFSLTPRDPMEQHLADRLHPPSREYPLGTDQLGRDVLSRILLGARVSMRVSITVVAISLGIGTAVGVTAGYAGGWVDEALMRLVDVLLAFPGLLLALVIAGVLGPSLTNIMIALAIVGWTQYARVVRGSVLSVKERDFVRASRLMDVPRRRLVVRHLLPNVISPVVVLATLDMATVVLATAALSFLGLGAQPPTPEWGTMLSQGRNYLQAAWWVSNVPGFAIMLTVLSFNVLGDSLRDVLDPRDEGGVQRKGGL